MAPHLTVQSLLFLCLGIRYHLPKEYNTADYYLRVVTCYDKDDDGPGLASLAGPELKGVDEKERMDQLVQAFAASRQSRGYTLLPEDNA